MSAKPKKIKLISFFFKSSKDIVLQTLCTAQACKRPSADSCMRYRLSWLSVKFYSLYTVSNFSLALTYSSLI